MNDAVKAAPKFPFRFFVLGAGFSRPAGLPLAGELWAEVYRRRADDISADLDRYIRFREKCDAVTVDPSGNDFDFEAFMGFLDIEHRLRLQGGDNWSDEGNPSQLIVRREIGRVLTERTPCDIPDLYLDFARELMPHDWVLTFNYDVLLERALEEVGQKFRRFPFRYSEISHDGEDGVTDDPDEVTLLKMHGSVDWFSREEHDELVEACGGERPLTRGHPMFGKDDKGTDAKFKAVPLLEGKQFKIDPLRRIFRLPKAADVSSFYRSDYPAALCAPFLLPPSTAKFVYLDKLLPLWRGMSKAGGYNLGLVVIGYSLPPHDNYVKLLLFDMAENYQGLQWGPGGFGAMGQKPPIVLVDRRLDAESRREYRRRYGFVDKDKARFHFDGFDEKAMKLIREMRDYATRIPE